MKNIMIGKSEIPQGIQNVIEERIHQAKSKNPGYWSHCYYRMIFDHNLYQKLKSVDVNDCFSLADFEIFKKELNSYNYVIDVIDVEIL